MKRVQGAVSNIEALEVEIDEAIYNLSDLTKDKQQVIEDYLGVF